MDTSEEYEKSKQNIWLQEKQQLIDDFEKRGKEKTDYSIEEHGDCRNFFYGVPVLKEGKLEGFNMMTFSKFYDETGRGFRSDDRKYNDTEGNQIFMTVDEYFKFYKEHEQKDERLGVLLKKAKEHNKIENEVLNNSKLAKVRNKLAKIADRIAEATGTEKIVQKITDGKKIADVEISPKITAIEKKISDRLFGKVNE